MKYFIVKYHIEYYILISHKSKKQLQKEKFDVFNTKEEAVKFLAEKIGNKIKRLKQNLKEQQRGNRIT